MVDNPSFYLETQRLAPYIEQEQTHLFQQIAVAQDGAYGMRENGDRDVDGECTLVINNKSPLNVNLFHYVSFYRPAKEGRKWTHVAFRTFHDPEKNYIANKLGVNSKFVIEVNQENMFVLGRTDNGTYVPKKGIRKLNPDPDRPQKELGEGEIDEDAFVIEELKFTADDLELMRETVGVLQGKLEQLRVQL